MSGNSVNVAGVEVSTDHWIGGRRVASKEKFADFSPVDGSHLADVSAGGKAEADAAVEAARKAFPAWAALGPKGRLPYLRKFAEGIKARMNDLAAVETMDNGSLLMGNVHRVVPRAAQNIEFFADWALTLDGHSIDSPEVVNHVKYDPAGVAVLITPWNAPLMLTTWKVGPALAAGNTVVVKPPEWAPLTCSLMADIAHEAGLPEGALSDRSTLIMVYALCGFANFGSVGILIGGLTALVPSRRHDIVTLGTRAIVSGTLATSMTGAVIGLII